MLVRSLIHTLIIVHDITHTARTWPDIYNIKDAPHINIRDLISLPTLGLPQCMPTLRSLLQGGTRYDPTNTVGHGAHECTMQ